MYVRAHELKPGGEERRISITTVMYHPPQAKVFLGTTDMSNDLLYTFDPKSEAFQSCGFRRIADRFDVKIHRSLVLEKDGSILGATAGLHGLQERDNAKGGKIFRYHPSDGSLELVARPVKKDYIQSIVLDQRRRIIYGFTYPMAHFFRYDLESGASKVFYINSLPHLPAMDDQGRVWGTWESDNRLFRYDPDKDEMLWSNVRLPRIRVSHRATAPEDEGQVDCMLNGTDGYLYIGSVSGGLFKLDPNELKIEYLGKPCLGLRMACLIVGDDGLLYGIGGMKQENQFFSYDRSRQTFKIIGIVHDAQRNADPFVSHHICKMGPKTFFTCETDNAERSGYLWEIRAD